MAVLKQIKFGSSSTPIAQTKVAAANGSVLSVDGINTALSDNENPLYTVDLNIDESTLIKKTEGEGTSAVTKLAVGEVPAAQVTVAAGAGIKATNAQAAFKELKDDIDAVGGAAKSYEIIKETTGLETNVKEQYKLQETVGSTTKTVGETIKIYKDSSLKSVELDDQKLVFTYILDTGAEKVVKVDVSKFLTESEFKDGLAVNDSGEVSAKLGQGLEFDSESGENKPIKVKIDSTSSDAENFLSVGANGVKISGVQHAIDASIAALDVTTDTAVTGQYVAAIQEADGVVSVKTRANVSDAVLNGYAKGEKPASTAIAATDDVKGAIAKLEHQIDDAKTAATTKVVEGTDEGNNMTIDTATSASDGSTTYTINLTDVASAQGLTGEITRAQSAETAIDSAVGLTKDASGEGRTYTNTGKYIGKGDTNTVASDIKALDTQLKTVTDKVGEIQYKVNGTTLEFFGMTEHA